MEGLNPTFYGSAEEKQKEEVLTHEPQIAAFIENMLHNAERNIGEGKTAEVAVWNEDNTTICVKLISETRLNDLYENSAAPRYNSPKLEGEMLDKVSNTSTKVRVPTPIGYIEFNDEFGEKVSALLMERVNAVTLNDIHYNQEGFPENFDIDVYFSELEKFLKQMHQHERIHHRDLSEGNLMIDRETGMPVVIDYGDATYDYGYDSERELY